MAHCWKDYRSYLEETGMEYSDEWVATYHDGNQTCMLEDGHQGEHDFINDNEIVIQFKGDPIVDAELTQ